MRVFLYSSRSGTLTAVAIGAVVAAGLAATPATAQDGLFDGPYVGLQAGHGSLRSELVGPRGPAPTGPTWAISARRPGCSPATDSASTAPIWESRRTPACRTCRGAIFQPNDRSFGIESPHSWGLSLRAGGLIGESVLLYGRAGLVRRRLEADYRGDQRPDLRHRRHRPWHSARRRCRHRRLPLAVRPHGLQRCALGGGESHDSGDDSSHDDSEHEDGEGGPPEGRGQGQGGQGQGGSGGQGAPEDAGNRPPTAGEADEDSDHRPDCAGREGDRTQTPGRGNQEPGEDKGDLHGDLYVVYRTPDGTPITTDQGFLQPIAYYDDGTMVLDENGDPVLLELNEEGEVVEGQTYEGQPIRPEEVEFGRTNVGRAPDAVLEHALDEALSKLAEADEWSFDAAGRLVLTTTADDGR